MPAARSSIGMYWGPGNDRADPGDLLTAIAMDLAADTRSNSKRALAVVRARSPELAHSSVPGHDLVATSGRFIDVMLASLQSELDLPWSRYEQGARDYGRSGAAQAIPLETLIEVLAILRRSAVELISQPLEISTHRDEVLALAQSRLANVCDRLTACIARGYLDYVDAEHRAREDARRGFGSAPIRAARAREP
jgi:hypothetical protein